MAVDTVRDLVADLLGMPLSDAADLATILGGVCAALGFLITVGTLAIGVLRRRAAAERTDARPRFALPFTLIVLGGVFLWFAAGKPELRIVTGQGAQPEHTTTARPPQAPASPERTSSITPEKTVATGSPPPGPGRRPTRIHFSSGGTIPGNAGVGYVVAEVAVDDPDPGDTHVLALRDSSPNVVLDGNRLMLKSRTGLSTTGTIQVVIVATDRDGNRLDQTLDLSVDRPAPRKVTRRNYRSCLYVDTTPGQFNRRCAMVTGQSTVNTRIWNTGESGCPDPIKVDYYDPGGGGTRHLSIAIGEKSEISTCGKGGWDVVRKVHN